MTKDIPPKERAVHAITATCPLTTEFRNFRAKMRFSLREYAEALTRAEPPGHVSRDYVKKLVRKRKPFPITPRIAGKFRNLQQTLTPPATAPRRRHRRVVIYTKYRVPRTVRLIQQPARCRGHGIWHIFRTPTQVYCNKQCRQLWRQKEKGKGK